MRAVTFHAPFDMRVEDVADPTIEQPSDAIIRLTSTNICGSDLHPYEGRAPMESGMVIGHENMGVVIEVGSGIDRMAVGDRVSVPFNIGCGTCRNCLNRFTSACLRANPEGTPGAGYGYPGMGPFQGGQAELLRVPYADFNLLKLPEGDENELDFAMLSDIFPTGWHGTKLAGLKPGELVVIFGAGPVGLMAAHSAELQGASQIIVVDKEPDRLRLAEQYGAIGVDFSSTDVAEAVMELTDGAGADRGVEAVGYQAHDAHGEEHPELVLDDLIEVVRATGGIGVVGVYFPEDPDAATESAKEGRIGFQWGSAWEKGLSFGTGQCPVKTYNQELRDLIIRGRAKPGKIVSHEVSLEDAPDAYKHFDARDEGWTKVVLHP